MSTSSSSALRFEITANRSVSGMRFRWQLLAGDAPVTQQPSTSASVQECRESLASFQVLAAGARDAPVHERAPL